MSLSIAHVCINTTRFDETVDFYVNGLGLARLFDFKKSGAIKGCYLGLSGRTFIEIFEVDTVSEAPSALAHLCLETDDIDGMRQRLMARGAAVTEKKKGCDDTYQIWFKDPNGIAVELHQYSPTSAQFHPRDLEMDW